MTANSKKNQKKQGIVWGAQRNCIPQEKESMKKEKGIILGTADSRPGIHHHHHHNHHIQADVGVA